MNFEYPIEIEKPEDHFGQNNSVGHYPLGRLFHWHGGLHIGENSNKAIHAIADGIVVAYRVCKGLKVDEFNISNSFLLVKHLYISPKGRELPFYSLYNHLMTYNEMVESGKFPLFLKENIFQVKSSNQDKGIDVNGLKLRVNGASPQLRKDVAVVPHGTICTLINDNSTPKGFVKVNYTSPNGKEFRNHLLWRSNDPDQIAKNKYIKVDEDNLTVEVMTSEDQGKSGDIGLHLRNSPNSSSRSIVKVLPLGAKMKIHPEDLYHEGYVRIIEVDGKAENGYVYKNCLELVKQDPVNFKNFDSTITGEDCDIAVKAGEIIGWAGQMGFEKNENYRTAHIEIFTDIDPSDFIKGGNEDLDDKKGTLTYTKVKKGSSLTIQYPIVIPKNDEIEVIEFLENDKYCKIRLNNQVREVYYDDLDDPNKKDSTDKYYYKPKNIDNLNKIFNDTLNSKSILHLEEILDKEATTGKKRRKVSYSIPSGEFIFWVEKQSLGITSKPDNPISITSTINKLYYKKPINDKIVNVLEQDYIEKTCELEKIIIKGGTETWYKIKSFTPFKNEFGLLVMR